VLSKLLPCIYENPINLVHFFFIFTMDTTFSRLSFFSFFACRGSVIPSPILSMDAPFFHLALLVFACLGSSFPSLFGYWII
jgi:hypothetical protein